MAFKRGFDFATLYGLALGIGSLLVSMTFEFRDLNPDLGTPFLKVSALLIIFGVLAGEQVGGVPGMV